MKVFKYQINNLDIYHIHTSKFKTIVAGVIFTSKLTKKYLAEKVLLSSMLVKTCKDYPNEQEYLKYLRGMYDTNIFADISKRGKTLQIMFTSNIVNPKYLNNSSNLFEETLTMLKNTLLEPYLINNKFTKELLDKEKRLLIEEIKAQYNNKRLQAIVGLIDNMFKNETYKIYSGLRIEEVESVTIESLTDAYQELLNDSCYGFVIGEEDAENIKKVFSNFDTITSKVDSFEYIDYENKKIKEVNEVVEVKDTNQSVLAMGFRTNIRLFENLYYPMCVMNGMLGGFFHSTLINEIREKEGLAYYIVSEYVPQKGFLAITSGINASDFEKVKIIINKIIDDYQSGKISNENLQMTKETMINGILEGDDSLLGLLNDIYRCAEHPNKALDLTTRIKKIEEVTLEQVIACAKSLTLDTIFLLKGIKSDEEVC